MMTVYRLPCLMTSMQQVAEDVIADMTDFANKSYCPRLYGLQQLLAQHGLEQQPFLSQHGRSATFGWSCTLCAQSAGMLLGCFHCMQRSSAKRMLLCDSNVIALSSLDRADTSCGMAGTPSVISEGICLLNLAERQMACLGQKGIALVLHLSQAWYRSVLPRFVEGNAVTHR